MMPVIVIVIPMIVTSNSARKNNSYNGGIHEADCCRVSRKRMLGERINLCVSRGSQARSLRTVNTGISIIFPIKSSTFDPAMAEIDDEETNPLQRQFSDHRFPVEQLVGPNVMEYFAVPGDNPFYDVDCVNQRIRQQKGAFDDSMLRCVYAGCCAHGKGP